MQRQYRELGETVWLDCGEEWFNYCSNSALYDTRSIPPRDFTPNNIDQCEVALPDIISKNN